MTSENEKAIRFKAKIFKALSDPVRLEILEFLREGEKCVCEITPHLNLIQPVVSRHLKILKDSGIICDRKDMNRRFYSITDHGIFKIIDGVTPKLISTYTELMIERIT